MGLIVSFYFHWSIKIVIFHLRLIGYSCISYSFLGDCEFNFFFYINLLILYIADDWFRLLIISSYLFWHDNIFLHVKLYKTNIVELFIIQLTTFARFYLVFSIYFSILKWNLLISTYIYGYQSGHIYITSFLELNNFFLSYEITINGYTCTTSIYIYIHVYI